MVRRRDKMVRGDRERRRETRREKDDERRKTR